MEYTKHGIPKYNARKTQLNTHTPRVQELSRKYNLTPKAVAYIRAAILLGRYSKDSLIEHIIKENKIRLEAIEAHKVNQDISEEDRLKLIEYTNINITFREGVVESLKGFSENELYDLLK